MDHLEATVAAVEAFGEMLYRLEPGLIRISMFAIFLFGLWHVVMGVIKSHRAVPSPIPVREQRRAPGSPDQRSMRRDPTTPAEPMRHDAGAKQPAPVRVRRNKRDLVESVHRPL